MAEMLSDAGYATAMFGKWHLGRTEGRFPTDQGFDEWYGIPNSTDESAYTELQGFAESGVEETYVMEARKGEKPRKVRPPTGWTTVRSSMGISRAGRSTS